jgi:hypothetical protein
MLSVRNTRIDERVSLQHDLFSHTSQRSTHERANNKDQQQFLVVLIDVSLAVSNIGACSRIYINATYVRVVLFQLSNRPVLLLQLRGAYEHTLTPQL